MRRSAQLLGFELEMLTALCYKAPKNVPIPVDTAATVLPMTSSLLFTPGWSGLVYQPHPEPKLSVDAGSRSLLQSSNCCNFSPRRSQFTRLGSVFTGCKTASQRKVLSFLQCWWPHAVTYRGTSATVRWSWCFRASCLGLWKTSSTSLVSWWQDRAGTSQLCISLVQMPWHCPFSCSINQYTYWQRRTIT